MASSHSSLQYVLAYVLKAEQDVTETLQRFEKKSGLLHLQQSAKKVLKDYDMQIKQAKTLIANSPSPEAVYSAIKPIQDAEKRVAKLMSAVDITLTPYSSYLSDQERLQGQQDDLPGEPTVPNYDISAELKKEYDLLNSFWQRAEKELAGYHTPITCSVSIDNYPDDDANPQCDFFEELGWDNVGRDWRICFGISSTNDPRPTEFTPILDCSSDIRLKAVDHFDALRTKLLSASREHLDKVRAANAKFAALLKR